MFTSAAFTREQLRIGVLGILTFAIATFAMPEQPAADDKVEVSGTLTANGAEIALPYVYVWREKQGFYDPADPTWRILFLERALSPREIGEPVWDSAWVEIGVTETSEFSDKAELHVYLQSIKLSADAAGNLSGGTYPQIDLKGLGTGRISGRIYHTKTQEFFDDTYLYDFTFTAPLSDPDAPIGDPLPAGGGEPGLAYLKWVETIHAGDVEGLRAIVPAELAAQIDSASEAEVKEQFEFMQLTTPTDVQIIKGSSDGAIAILEIEGKMEGQKVTGEIEMTKMGKFWIPTKSSM